MAITRTAWIDDDGSGTTGTVINNAEKTTLYNQIDAAIAAGLIEFAEGNYTPADISGAGLTLATAVGGYVKIGPLIFVSLQVVWPATANGASTGISLPVLPVGYPGWSYPGGWVSYTNYGAPLSIMCDGAGLHLFTYAGAPVTNANMTSKDLRATMLYRWR